MRFTYRFLRPWRNRINCGAGGADVDGVLPQDDNDNVPVLKTGAGGANNGGGGVNRMHDPKQQQNLDALVRKYHTVPTDSISQDGSSNGGGGAEARQDVDATYHETQQIRQLLFTQSPPVDNDGMAQLPLQFTPTSPPHSPLSSPRGVTSLASIQEQDESREPTDDHHNQNHSFAHEIEYTFKEGNGGDPPPGDGVSGVFNVPPPDGSNLRTVTELLEGSDALPPWLRNMLVDASKTANNTNKRRTRKQAELPALFRCQSGSAASVESEVSEDEEEADSILSSFSDLSSTSQGASSPCSWFICNGVHDRQDKDLYY